MGERSRGIALGYVYVVVQSLATIIYTPLLLSGIGESEYGLYQLVGSLAAYINILESLLTSSVLRFYCKSKASGNKYEMENILGLGRFLYRCGAMVTALLGVLMTLAFRFIYASSLSDVELDEGMFLLIVLVANVVMNMLNYSCSVVLTANERFTFTRTMDLVTVVAQPVIVILIIQKIPYALVVTCVQFMINASVWAIKQVYERRSIGAKAHIREFAWPVIKPLIVFSLTVSVAMIADMVFWKTDQLIIGLLSGTTMVTVYSIGSTVFTAYNSFGMVISSVFMPHLSELSTNDNYRELLTHELIKTGRIASFIITAIFVGFALYGKEFLMLWVGAGYEDAYFVALFMMAANYFDIVQRLGATILQVLNKYSFRMVIYVACALVNIPLTIILTNRIGVIGAALSSAIVLAIGSGVIMNTYYKRVIGLNIRQFWIEISRGGRSLPISILIGCLINRIAFNSLLLTFLTHVILFSCVFIFGVIITINEEERALLHHLFERR